MGEETELLETVRSLLSSQRLAALSTRSGDQPYSNLICFVASHDLKQILFATTRSTRKYANLMGEARVSLRPTVLPRVTFYPSRTMTSYTRSRSAHEST
jgi:hypothetical protein